MNVVPGDDVNPTISNQYQQIVNKANDQDVSFEMMGRFEFYERAKSAYSIVATSETAIYANIILKKGVI